VEVIVIVGVGVFVAGFTVGEADEIRATSEAERVDLVGPVWPCGPGLALPCDWHAPPNSPMPRARVNIITILVEKIKLAGWFIALKLLIE
jgi:hypothetical protein